MPKGPNGAKILELFLCGLSLTFALPMSIALFKQDAVLEREQMDEEF